MSACSTQRAFRPETFAYVYNVGNADMITLWTLGQTDEGKIKDGMFALAGMEGDRDERKRAAAGFVRAYEKLVSGWPRFRAMDNPAYYETDDYGDLPLDRNDRHLEKTIRLSYDIVTMAFRSDWYPTYLKIKPDPSHHGRMEAWRAAGRRSGLASQSAS